MLAKPPTPLRIPRRRAALAGVLTAAVALGATELAAGVVGGASPVIAVGGAVIDGVPPAVKDLAIRWFGTADKPVLVAGILLLSAAFGAGVGVLGAHRRAPADALLVAFAVLGLGASLRDPRTTAASAVMVAAAGALAGIVALHRLLAMATPSELPDQREDVAQEGRGTGRRAFVTGLLGAAAVAGSAAATGRALSGRAAAAASRAGLTIPPPAQPAPRAGPETEVAVEGVSGYVTPNDEFYRIDTALSVPRVDVSTWSLRVTGQVEREVELSFDELTGLGLEEHWATLACVSNEVGGHLVGNALWRGVPLSRVLDLAGVRPGADQVVGRSVDGWTAGFPTLAAFDGRAAMVAVAMNDEPLPPEHGFPARLVVPGLYGYVSATKWLSEIELTTFETFQGYWVPRGWAREAPIRTASRIDVPRAGSSVAAGQVAVGGVAWAPGRGVNAVEVQVDDGPWESATAAEALNDDTWRQWSWRWPATVGRHRLRVRAVDGTGETQTGERRPVAPDGATGWHTVEVEVT